MDNQRLIVWSLFGLMLFLTWQAWIEDYAPRPAPTPAAVEEPAEAVDLPELPSAPDSDDEPAVPEPAAATAEAPGTAAPARLVRVTTDVFDITLSTRGGTLTAATMRRYPVHKDRPEDLVELLGSGQSDFGAIRTGLRDSDADRPMAGDDAIYEVQELEYRLAAGQNELVVPFTWRDGDGVTVEKRLRFTRGSYAIGVTQTLSNESGEPRRVDQYAQLLKRSVEPDRSMFDVDSYSFNGPLIYDGERSEKLKRDELLDEGVVRYDASDGWVAVIQHHFMAAIVPRPGVNTAFQVEVRGDTVFASVVGPKETIAPGDSHTFERTLFVGPKLQAQLEAIDPKLKLAVDYGFLTILSQPMFWLLSWVYRFVGNWGVAIIVVTVLIKLAFYKLTEASGRSMAKMRNLQPRMKALQERYKDDRQQLSQAMMELYKREKVNPAAGCLPILIQMPFFLAFYWVLVESVEMRQAPFALWISDLSARDPYFVLPLIMGAAMFLQQRLNPAPADPVQARVMQIMPIVFTGFFAFFPSGLVLYWATNTVLSIAQQWKINRVVEAESKQKKAGKAKKT